MRSIHLNVSVNDSYHFAFGVACVSLIVSMAIYYLCRSSFKHVEGSTKQKSNDSKAKAEYPELSPKETKDRIIALCLVFTVVIFFWMAFHQNGLTLTYFADEFTAKSSDGLQSMMFDVWNLVAVIFIVYALFSLVQSKTGKAKAISAAVIVLALAFLGYRYNTLEGSVDVNAPIFQQFNPFFVVALTPVSMAIFGSLARKVKSLQLRERLIGYVSCCLRIHSHDDGFIRLVDSGCSSRSITGWNSYFCISKLVGIYLLGFDIW